MEQLIPIGQFARLTRLSPKALRLYAENGLLPPSRVDPETGYRYYRTAQVDIGRRIRLLREAGMPLAEIATFLGDPTAERLDAFAAEQKARQAERARVLRFVRRTLGEEQGMTFEVRIKETTGQPFVSRSATVAIGDLDRFIVRSVAELSAEVEAAGPPFTLFHDPVNDETDGRIEVCLPTAERGAEGGALPAGAVAWTVVEGAQAEYPEILAAYDAVADWAKRHGHELSGPPREIYLSAEGDPERMEIAWPIG